MKSSEERKVNSPKLSFYTVFRTVYSGTASRVDEMDTDDFLYFPLRITREKIVKCIK